jgi:hypothetical protein
VFTVFFLKKKESLISILNLPFVPPAVHVACYAILKREYKKTCALHVSVLLVEKSDFSTCLPFPYLIAPCSKFAL